MFLLIIMIIYLLIILFTWLHFPIEKENYIRSRNDGAKVVNDHPVKWIKGGWVDGRGVLGYYKKES